MAGEDSVSVLSEVMLSICQDLSDFRHWFKLLAPKGRIHILSTEASHLKSSQGLNRRWFDADVRCPVSVSPQRISERCDKS